MVVVAAFGAAAACGARTGLESASELVAADVVRGDAVTDAVPDRSPPPPPPCTTDRECDDRAPCTRDRCSPAGACEHAPIAMGDPRVFPLGPWVADLATHAGGVWALLSPPRMGGGAAELVARRITLDGPTTDVRALGTTSGDRTWDSALASTGDTLAAVAHVGGRLELRTERDPTRTSVLAPGGLFVTLAWTGARLLATSDATDACSLGWADASGAWTSRTPEATTGGCAFSQVGATGRPPYRHPVAFSEGGAAATYLSVLGNGTVTRLVARQGSQRAEPNAARFAFPGPAFYHSLVAVEGPPGRVGALWVQMNDTGDRGPRQMGAALLDAVTLRPVGPIISQMVEGDPYAPTMSIAYCEERFVGVWHDALGAAVIQLNANGVLLGDVLRFWSPLSAVDVRAACTPGGVVIARFNEVATLRCAP